MHAMPNGWNITAHRAWLDNKANEAIQAVIKDINGFNKEKPESLTMQLAYYLFLIGDYPSVCNILETVTESTTNHEVLLNLAVCYRRMERNQDAIDSAVKALSLAPRNVTAHDVLASAYYGLGDTAKAAEAGTRALNIKNENILKSQTGDWQLPRMTPQDFAGQATKQNVITFSLWGKNPRYLRGALRNLLLAPDFYPEWKLRFHLDDSVPGDFVELIRKLGGQVIVESGNQATRNKLCWRFKVANDPGVGRFLVRDVDSVFSIREVQAVEDWIASDKWFHVMRDWWTHTDLMLAGMWGGVAGILPPLDNMLENYESRMMETPHIDQWFLRDQVWAYARLSCLIHDRCFNMPGTTPLKPSNDNRHIGQNEAVLDIQTRTLAAWIDQYPCLAIP